jgi:hypothetical protein
MSKTIGGRTTQFLYDGLNPVQELNSSNGVVANLMTGMSTDEYFTRTASGTTSTFLDDAVGSTIGLVTSKNSSIVTNYTYQPFGATTIGGSANGNSYEFTPRKRRHGTILLPRKILQPHLPEVHRVVKSAGIRGEKVMRESLKGTAR